MVSVYTDGSCISNPGQGGWAYVIINNEEIYSDSGFEKKTTNNRMELTALLKAMEKIEELGLSRDYPHYYIDSLYTTNIVSNKSKNINVNNDLVDKIMNFKAYTNGLFFKIKSHSGLYWNDYVDMLANQKARRLI
jgi:ribonuclease HI